MSSLPSPSKSPSDSPWCPMPPCGMKSPSRFEAHSSCPGTSWRRKEGLAPNAASVASVKTGAGARLRRWSRAVHSVTRQAASLPFRHRICQRPTRSVRPPPRAAPTRSKRTVVRTSGSSPPVTSIPVMRNSAVCTDSKSPTRATSSRRNEAGSRVGSGGSVRARKTSSCGLLPRETSSAGVRRPPLNSAASNGSAASAACAGPSRSRALSSPRRPASSSASLLLGKRVASGHEVLLRHLQRRRDAALGVVAVDRGRAGSHAPASRPGPCHPIRTRGGGRGTEPRLDEGSCPRSSSIRSRSRL